MAQHAQVARAIGRPQRALRRPHARALGRQVFGQVDHRGAHARQRRVKAAVVRLVQRVDEHVRALAFEFEDFVDDEGLGKTWYILTR
jgi:hypothetical protein